MASMEEGAESHVQFGRVDKVDPWMSLLQTIYEELNPDILDGIIQSYGMDDMPPPPEDFTKRTDTEDSRRRRFFNVVDKGSDVYTKARSLKEVLHDLDLYTEWGQSWGDKVQGLIDKLDAFNAQFKIEPEELFLGRQEDMDVIEEKLNNPRVKCLCLSGLGGRGKSSVARHLCQQMFSRERNPWFCIVVDARELDEVDLILQALAEELKKHPMPKIPSSNEPGCIVNEVLETTKMDTVWLLDNCDRVYEEDKRMFLQFLDESINRIYSTEGTSKVKFLLTLRQEVSTDKMTPLNNEAFVQMTLPPMCEEDAVQLLMQTAGKKFPESEDYNLLLDIVKECACSPQAITVISGLLRSGDFTPRKLKYHLKHDTKNVTKALSVSDCIRQAFEAMDEKCKKCLLSLSVFQTTPFSEDAAFEMLKFEWGIGGRDILKTLVSRHLLQFEVTSEKKGSDGTFSLHPLVYRFMVESNLRRKYRALLETSVKTFLEYYEKKICKIVGHLESNALKGASELQANRSHIVRFYNIWDSMKNVQKPYTKIAKTKEILVKTKVVDCLLSNKLISDVKKRRIFSFESDRAKRAGNLNFQIFWKVQEANLYVMFHDKAGVAEEALLQLSKDLEPLGELSERDRYNFMVHAAFHTVKGKCRWKQRQFPEALKHLDLALHFYERGEARKDAKVKPDMKHKGTVLKAVDTLKARVMKYKGLIHLDMNEYMSAEQLLQEAFATCAGKSEPQDKKTTQKRKFHFDLPEYKGYFGAIEIRKADDSSDDGERERHLFQALEYLKEGMMLDEQLKIDNLDGYCYKLLYVAEVLRRQGHIDAALSNARCAMDQRRAILQLPHFSVTESVYQMASLHLVKSYNCADVDDTKLHWRISRDYFRELEEHHLKYGGISLDHPLLLEIRGSHLEVLDHLGDVSKLRETEKFYNKLLGGGLAHEAEGAVADFKRMTHTMDEILANAFGGGGSRFGEKDGVIALSGGEETDPRRDSGMGYSSSEGGGASLSSGSGSLSDRMARAHIQPSISVEDEVFIQGSQADGRRLMSKKSRRSEN